ncbi:MAG: HEAT repeat domain-containing protein [Nitrospirae bacterium]|nr:HEAT repeat domain-containing protein [Nitrospirota bacterium]
MTKDFDKIPLDAKLLSYAIIELNISRRSVGIYPKGHPSVERAINRAFKFLNQLFEIRPRITFAIAKDTIILDEYHLDRKNPVYREFALSLSKMNIAYITFKNGITKDELYNFHSFLTEKTDNLNVNNLEGVYQKYKLNHIEIGVTDYSKFLKTDQKIVQQSNNVSLWERYIYGLLEGKLQNEKVSDELREIPPELLAKILNKTAVRNLKEEAYDKVIATYIRSSPEHIFSSNNLKRLLELVNNLRPDLKKQFLSSAVKTFSKDTESTYQTMKNISIEEIEDFLNVVNEQRVTVPEPLMELIKKLSLSTSVENKSDTIYIDEDELRDDEFLLSNYEEFFSDETHDKETGISLSMNDLQEIQSLLKYDASVLKSLHLIEFGNEFNEDLIEKRFIQLILEMMYSETVSEQEYQSFMNILKEQTEQLLWIGQFGQFFEILKAIELNKALYRFVSINSEVIQYYHSPEFIKILIDSFRILGRQQRKEVSMICDYYDKKIIPYLMDALAEEESLIIRRFLMELIKQFGNKVIPEAIRRLEDDRWFVKRNMIYILNEIDCKEAIDSIRPLSLHDNLKVSIPAIKYLLNAGDTYAKELIKKLLYTKSNDLFEQAVALSGAFRIKEVVSDLIQLLKKKDMIGEDILRKKLIVKALGDIGDIQALNTLRDLLSGKSILFGKMMEHLKEEIYKTLKNYPYHLVKDLVEAGLKSKNDLIREESSRLFKEKEG